jgi:PAS domain-containing protein
VAIIQSPVPPTLSARPEEESRRHGAGPDDHPGPNEIIDKVAATGHLGDAVSRLVRILRRSDYSIADLLIDAAAGKARAGGHAPVLDRLVAGCVDRTALVHETAIETMLHGFCELDERGRVIYANAALLKLLPDCEGRELALFFASDRETVREALRRPAERRSYRFQLGTTEPPRPVLVEFGPVARGAAAAYAIVTDLSEEENAQRRSHDLAQFGIIKLDPERHITYANEAACRLLGASQDSLIGFDAAQLVSRREDEPRMEHERVLREQGVGTEYDLEVKPLDASPTATLRVRSLPERDVDDHLSGVFVTLSPIDAELVGQQVRAEIAAAKDPEPLFVAVLDHVRPLIPFACAMLWSYTGKRKYVRRVHSEPPWAIGDGWIPVPEPLRDVGEGPRPYGDDIQAFIGSVEGGEQLLGHTAVERLMEKGLAGWFAMPVKASDWDAILLLIDDQPDRYGEGTRELLEKVGVPHAMQAVLKLEGDREAQFQLELVKSMAQTRGDRELAALVVGELARFYRWHNVAIFKINTIKNQFELLEQAAGPDGYKLPSGYRQPLDQGYLGLTYSQNRIQLLGDSEDGEAAGVFVRGSKHTRCELCVPIRVEGKMVWVLNIEDRRPHAFRGPDRDKLARLMGELEPALERLLIAALLDQVLDAVPDGLVITDLGGRIVKGNLTARKMLGGAAAGTLLQSFFPESSEGAAAVVRETSIPVEATLTDTRRHPVSVLISTKSPREEYDRRVVLLQDREKLNWQAETRELLDALGQVAAQVRVPLSFVSTFVRQIKRATEDSAPQVAEMATHAIEQLGRVELTYDRVIGRATSIDLRSTVEIDELLAATLARLPAEQSSLVRIRRKGRFPPLSLDANQMSWAIEAMLAYLLRIGDAGVPINVQLLRLHEAVALTMLKVCPPAAAPTEAAPAPTAAEDAGAAIDAARARLALDQPRLHQIASSHGGTFRYRRLLDVRNGELRQGEALRLVLPAKAEDV